VALGDEAIIKVAQEDLAVQLRAEPEIEVVHGLLEGEGGVLEPPAELIVFAGEQFFLQQAAQEVGIRHLRLGGAIEPLLVDLADPGELKLGEHLIHGAPPQRPTKAS
jgi:hypothetical protein